MAKIDRKKIARGTTLYRKNMYQTLEDAADELGLPVATRIAGSDVTVPNINTENLETPNGVFRLNFHIPYAGARFFSNPYDRNALLFPFTLPPLQDYWDDDAKTDEDTPSYTLLEFGLSFDQRSENVAIGDAYYTANKVDPATNKGKYSGFMNYDEVDDYNIRISLLEKDQWKFNQSEGVVSSTGIDPYAFIPKKEIFSTTLTSTNFNSRDFRNNPLVIADLNEQLKPYKTYILCFNPDALNDTANVDGTSHAEYGGMAYVSLNLNLKLKTPLVKRDTYDGSTNPGSGVPSGKTQNLPDKHDGKPTVTTTGLDLPAATSVIKADETEGFSTNIEAIDEVFVDKLKGGYSAQSEVSPYENVITDAGYEIICVPVWGGQLGDIRVQDNVTAKTDTNFGKFDPYLLPWANHASTDGTNMDAMTQKQVDRRIIPLAYPMTIHHVIGCISFNSPKVTDNAGTTISYFNRGSKGTAPEEEDLKVQIGVGMGTGLRGDYLTYEQVALLDTDMLEASRQALLIDRVKWIHDTLSDCADGYSRKFDYELINIPLVYKSDTKGNGYYDQGHPIYVGAGWGRDPTLDHGAGGGTFDRSVIAQGINSGATSAVAATKGLEQFLEVRWQFYDSTGIGPRYDGSTKNYRATDVLVGLGGFWIFIIGKKHLA